MSENIEKNICIIKDPNNAIDSDADEMRQMAFKLSWQVIIGNILRGGIDSRLQALTTACNLLKIQSDLLSTKTFDKFYFPSHMLQVNYFIFTMFIYL